jgi:DNA-binding response OmpR family regulator
MKILLLEDELMLQSSIEEYLRSLGHMVRSFSKGDEVIDILKIDLFDIHIFDINVPNINGFEVLKYLQQQKIFTPTIFISALVDIDDITKAFDLGAYDYLKKPFHLKELGLRINNVTQFMDRQNREHILLSQNYTYSKENNELLYYGKVQTLTKKQTLMLELFCHNIDMVLSFEHFRQFVWDHEPIENGIIRSEISRFRRVLKEDFIQNIKGIGYKAKRYIKS